jgi:SAM-dependent methyltransferase
MNCRHCQKELKHLFLDLGFAPPSNAYRLKKDLQKPEMMYSLRTFVCDKCWLVQTEDFVDADELFSPEYAYFSSTSSSWLDHAAKYCEMIQKKISLNSDSLVVEVASNDGYLLKNFVEAGIPCIGIEPTDSTADAAERIGVPVQRMFFGEELGKQFAADGKQADLIAGNNVYAHVPNINDFTRGLKAALKTGGTITLEFPHLMQLLEHTQFDTVYHEHFSYLSLHTVNRIFTMADLRLFDVEQLPTHGGSLRIYGCHVEDPRETTESVQVLLNEEKLRGMRQIDTYLSFQPNANKIKNDLLAFLIEQKHAGKVVAGYGAAAKGNTLLNYAGIKPELLPFVCDAASSKQGNYLPGSHIPIYPPDYIKERKPDYILILPWNLKKEIINQLKYIKEWGAKFVLPIPVLEITQ